MALMQRRENILHRAEYIWVVFRLMMNQKDASPHYSSDTWHRKRDATFFYI